MKSEELICGWLDTMINRSMNEWMDRWLNRQINGWEYKGCQNVWFIRILDNRQYGQHKRNKAM